MREQKYSIHIEDGVSATITIKAKNNFVEPFKIMAKCPSKSCKIYFNSCNEDIKLAKDQIANKIKAHWTESHNMKDKICSHCQCTLIRLKSKIRKYCKDCSIDLKYRTSFSVAKGYRKNKTEK